ncbi:MAG: hypothetical protein ABSE82_16985 [Nitrososphaerales archaeon]|jgi:hypothetical protein
MARINIMSSTKSITVVLILFSLLVPLFPGIAVAAGRPALTWNFSDSQVTSDTPLLASFVFNGLPTGSIVTFERGFGTASFLRPVARYSASGAGSMQITLPSVPLGFYHYKVLVSTSAGRVILQTSLKPLYSYGTIPFSSLCGATNASVGGSGCGLNTVQVGANLFTYDLEGNFSGYQPPNYATLIMFPANTCRSITLNFALSETNTQPTDTAYIQIIQTTLDPEQASTPQGTVGTLVANLDGGPWYLQNSAINGDNVYYNGSASCWTASGVN